MHKFIVSIFSLLLTTGFVFSQQSKLSYSIVKRLAEEKNKNKPAALFVKGNIETIKSITQNNGGHFKFSANDVAAIVLPISKVSVLAESNDVFRIEDNSMKLIAMNDSMRAKNNVDAVQMGVSPLPQAYDGSGVVMGIIDSGIDFTHPDFKDSLDNTRIISIWDHNLSSGTSPAPYTYGTEFTSADIMNGNAAAHVDNSNGHGTHVTGVAAGNGRAIGDLRYRGVAPKADIISVCVNWNLPGTNWLSSVADAVEYIYTKANTLGKPCVINISAGTYFGSHDGKDLQAQIIDGLITAQNKRALVCAAGNLGSWPLHTQNNITTNNDTVFTWVKEKANVWGSNIYTDIWADTADFNQTQISIGADQSAPAYNYRGALPFRNMAYHLNTLRNDTLYSLSGNRLAIVQSFGELIGDRYQLQLTIIPDSIDYNFRISSTGIGSFDMWSYNYMPNPSTIMPGFVIPTAATYPAMANYNLPDVNQNVVSSFSCSDKVLTVGETGNKPGYLLCTGTYSNNATIIPNALADLSAHGPTRDGRIKPDLTASGGRTLSPIASYVPNNKRDSTCMYFRDGGTSTASPVVAGVAALLFQRYPNASWLDIKNCILGNTLVDSFITIPVPNNLWGYGKVDAFAALTGCSLTFISNQSGSLAEVVVFPNPHSNEATIKFILADNFKKAKKTFTVYNTIGELVYSKDLQQTAGEFHLSQLKNAGIYFYKLSIDNTLVKTGKVVKL